jgi:hypothetical protein
MFAVAIYFFPKKLLKKSFATEGTENTEKFKNLGNSPIASAWLFLCDLCVLCG